MINTQEKHAQVIDHLKEKYRFSRKELLLLEEIKENTIHSVSFTSEGGFNSKTGEFHSEEDKSTYKVKIKYEEKGSNNMNIVYLISSVRSNI
ncbi:MAG: hypothetical protein WB492_15175 [Christiangramia sp.]